MGICKVACMGTSYSLAQISAKTYFYYQMESRIAETAKIFRYSFYLHNYQRLNYSPLNLFTSASNSCASRSLIAACSSCSARRLMASS